jgi:cold shock CspA family protein
MQGKVSHYDDQRGFGFITCPDSHHVFFHISEVFPRVFQRATHFIATAFALIWIR